MDVSLVPQDERNIFYVFHGAQTVCQLFQENVDLISGRLCREIASDECKKFGHHKYASECRPREKYPA